MSKCKKIKVNAKIKINVKNASQKLLNKLKLIFKK